jgi:hypothetical protein
VTRAELVGGIEHVTGGKVTNIDAATGTITVTLPAGSTPIDVMRAEAAALEAMPLTVALVVVVAEVPIVGIALHPFTDELVWLVPDRHAYLFPSPRAAPSFVRSYARITDYATVYGASYMAPDPETRPFEIVAFGINAAARARVIQCFADVARAVALLHFVCDITRPMGRTVFR